MRIPEVSFPWSLWFRALAGLLLLALLPAATARAAQALVDVPALRSELALAEGRPQQLLLLDASPTPRYRAAHIPGAISADYYAYGLNPGGAAQMQQRLRRWGVLQHAGQRIVLYDRGGSHEAPRLYFDLISHGVAPTRIRLLDGGLHQWKAQGGALSSEAVAVPAGDFSVEQADPRWRAELPEVLARQAVLLDALDPAYYFGAERFMDRGGHLPGALNLPASSLFRADKTFVPAAELEARLQRLGLRREQRLISYCGGGVAAAVPFFALQALLGWPQARLYVGSQREYLLDERQLPLWQEARPIALRDRAWLEGWGQPMMRQMDAVHFALVDLRPAPEFERQRLPHAINLPSERWLQLRQQPQALAQWLGEQGLRREQEVVLVNERGGLDADKALALVLLESLGQWRVSLLREGVSDWALAGAPLEKGTSPAPARPQPYGAQPVDAVFAGSGAAGLRVVDVDGRSEGAAVPLALSELLDAGGQALPAAKRWERFAAAGLAADAPLLIRARQPGDAAMGYLLLRQLGAVAARLER